MKILQVNCVYNYGSTGKITHDIHKELLRRGFESVVYYGRRERVSEPGVHKICSEVYAKANNLRSRVTGLMYGGCELSTARLIRAIRKEQPDVVHLQCINGYFVNIYKLLTWLKKNRIKTVLTLHAEFMYTANCGHALDCEKWRTGCGDCPRLKQETMSWFFDRTANSQQRMRQAFDGFGKDLLVISVSPWLRSRAEASAVLAEMCHRVVLNGADTKIFTYRPSDLRGRFREEKLVFHATPTFSDDPDHLKGGYAVLEMAKRMPEVRFVVAGSASVSGEVPQNVTLLGQVRDQKLLAQWYSAADVTLLTSKRETFSMVCAESLCCGTPVVGFEAGGPEMITLPEYSQFVPQGDLDALEHAVTCQLSGSREKEFICSVAKKHYAKEIMLQEYIDCYRGIHNEDLC